jgi:hypothetical protein
MLCGPNLFIIYVYSKIQDEALVIVELARKALVKAGMLSAHFFFFMQMTQVQRRLQLQFLFFLKKWFVMNLKIGAAFRL